MTKKYFDELGQKQIKLVWGDGRNGYEKHAPYDVIHCGASSEEVPEKLVG